MKLPVVGPGHGARWTLSAGHAQALARSLLPDEQEALADEVLRRALSVRQTEKRAASIAAGPSVRHERRRDPFTRDAEEKLSRRLHAKVRIVRRRRGGEIEIAFGSEEELIGLFERLAEESDRRQAPRRRSADEDHEVTGTSLNGFLDRGSQFAGELTFEETFRIDGKFEGKIRPAAS